MISWRWTRALAATLALMAVVTAAPAQADEDDEGGTSDRDLLTATIGPELLTVQPGDSRATRRARAELAELAGRLETVVAQYDEAAESAAAAERRARRVHVQLRAARSAATEAAAQFREDRQNLVNLVNGSYMTVSLGGVGLLLASHDGADLIGSMSIAEQVNADQSAVVQAAHRSADRLAGAEERAEALDGKAQRLAGETGEALEQARSARQAVTDEVAAARELLAGAVLADQAEAGLDAAALAGLKMAEGAVVFPLAPGASFVDQDNFGRRSSRWASYHTGVDFSTGCGTPVLAATAGTVEVRTDQSWSGRWLVMVTTGPGTVATWYAHMQALSVSDGEQVEAGQVLGQVGTEGNSSGCHLHFEYHPAGGSIYEDATNPVPWLEALGAYPGR